MVNHKEILRLKSLGLMYREIAASCGCGRNSVTRTLVRAREQSLSWDKAQTVSPQQVSNPIPNRTSRHLVDELRGTDRKQTLRELLVRHSLRQRPFQTAVRRPLQHGNHGIPGALATCSDLGLAETQAVELEELTVIGHISDLLADICTAKRDACLYFTNLLNASGGTAQSRRNGCSISRGILNSE